MPSVGSDNPNRAIFIAVATCDAIIAKGILHLITERDESGFFDHVFSIHLLARKNRTFRLNEKNTVIEYGGKYFAVKEREFIALSILLNSIDSFVSLSGLIASQKIGLIRATDPSFHGLYAEVLGWVNCVPVCISIHADYDKRHKLGKDLSPEIFGSRSLAKILEGFVLSHAAMIMPIRESLGDWAIKNGADKKKIRIIPHGVETRQWIGDPDIAILEKYHLRGKKLAVFAGRLSKDNYVGDIVEAANIVVRKNPDVVFILIGDGTEKSELTQRIAGYHLNNNVILPGFLPNESVRDFRLHADVNLCLMGGFSLIEAALSGKPTLAYDVEWHYELIKNQETGYLIKERDIDGIANAVLEVIANPKLTEHLGRNARELAIKRHSLENTSKIKIQWYKELLQMSHR